MAGEISVSAILIEMDDGTYRAQCPDLGLSATGKNSDEAIRNLKDEITKMVKEKGADNVQLSAVKCVRLKIPVG